MKKQVVRLIGDVHGHSWRYLRLAEQAKFSLQVGDMGFDYSHMSELDPEHHKVLGGNHDNYATDGTRFINQTPHFLGDYGTCELGGNRFFYTRGALSIDRKYRTQGVDWWPEEELGHIAACKAFELYKATKPDVVVTHEAPCSISDLVSTIPREVIEHEFKCQLPSFTAKLLQEMWNEHQPKLWVFGHFHRDWRYHAQGTTFICLDELKHMDFSVGG